MTQFRDWVRSRPIVAFFLLTFVLTWGLGFSYVWLLRDGLFYVAPLAAIATCAPALVGILVTAICGGQGRPSLRGNPRRWIVFFLALVLGTAVFVLHNHFINGAPLSPVFYVFALLLWTPPVAFIISAAHSRGTAVRAMMGSLLTLRGVAGWALLALLLLPTITLLSVLMSNLLGRLPAEGVSDAVLGLPLFGLIAIKFLYQMFFFNATGEESGWSGFARPQLQAHVSPLVTAVIVALFWAPWHLFLWYGEGRPVFELSFWFEAYANMIPMSIIFTWLYNRSKGSILVAGIAHAAANTATAFLPRLDLQVLALMMGVLALLLVLIERMWQRLPEADPAVGHVPRPAV